MRETHRRNASEVAKIAAFSKENAVDLRTVELDVLSQDSVDAAVSKVIGEIGRIDVLIHNAGHMVFGPAEAFTPEQLAQLYDVNVLSTQRVNRAVLPHLRGQKQGLVVWVSSSSSAGGTPPYLAPYFAAKAGMDAMAVVYARELSRWGIETSIIVPGALGKGGSFEPTEIYKALDDFMTEFQPGLTALDVLVSFFCGEERNRTHVRQFANLLLALCRKHHSAILLLAHPSLTGMNTGSGLSGSTDWHNVFRSRAYLETVKDDGRERLFFRGKKNNYGQRGEDIELEYKNCLFVPVKGTAGFNKLATDAYVDDLFLVILKRFNSQGRNASHITGKSYAPALFAKDPDGHGIASKQFEAAMNRLFKANKIAKQNNGTKSRPENTLVPTEDTG